MPNLVLTVTAADRPGLVAELSDTLAAHGANWEEGRLARLAGTFAGIVLVCVDPERADDLKQAVEALGEAGALRVDVTAAPGTDAPTAGEVMSLRVTGQDHPGIVREISQALASQGVTIDELHTSISDAPMAGGTLFEAEALVRLPDGVDDDALRERLEQIADEIMVDLRLDEE